MSKRAAAYTATKLLFHEGKRSSRRTSAVGSIPLDDTSSSSGKTPRDSLPAPEPTQDYHTRKHATEASVNIHEVDMADVEQEMSPSHTRGSSGDSRSSAKSVCLCQPVPKIPRPRNAFILYRQHHQGAVSAQNPGLANPDISKVIGEQWRAESTAVKGEWQHLAEEEKLRHQQQYPEYRYRPKRNDRRGSVSDSGSKDSPTEKHRCSKCGGRSITSTSPKSSSVPELQPSPHAPPSGRGGTPAVPMSRDLPMVNNLSLMSPQVRRVRGAPVGMNINAAASRQRMIEDLDSPSSPDPKRRRYNTYQPQYVSGRIPASPGTPYFAPPPISTTHHLQSRRQSLPPPADLFRTSPPNTAGLMGPPPTPGRRQHALPMSPFAYEGPKPPGWERASLTLPPLHNGGSPGLSSDRATQHATADESKLRERRSVEAMVMSMSHLGKLRILRNIAPPIGGNPTSPPPDAPIGKSPRGAVIAVEGFSRVAVAELTTWLGSFLGKTDDYDIKMLDGPRVPDWKSKASIADVLGVVREWHQRSLEMVEFVHSTAPAQAVQSAEDGDENMDDNTDPPSRAPEGVHKVPVVLLKTYTLQACDRYACAIPIQDAYSPADHWQWMATLWRGIPSADIVIYIKEVDGTRPVDSGDKSGAATRAAAEREKIGTVDIVEEAGLKCLLVWKERGKEVGSSALRRVGFELGEWIRTFGSNQV